MKTLSSLLVLGIASLGLTGCQSPPIAQEASRPSSPAPTTSSAPDADSAVAPLADPRVDAFLAALSVDSQQSRSAADHAFKIARKELNDSDFSGAQRHLRLALRHDPSHREARRLLDEVGFMLGERTHEIQLVAQELGDLEVVRRKVQLSDLNRWLGEGKALLEAGEPDAAAQNFARVLEHIQWYHQDRSGSVDRRLLSDLETATRRAQKTLP